MCRKFCNVFIIVVEVFGCFWCMVKVYLCYLVLGVLGKGCVILVVVVCDELCGGGGEEVYVYVVLEVGVMVLLYDYWSVVGCVVGVDVVYYYVWFVEGVGDVVYGGEN